MADPPDDEGLRDRVLAWMVEHGRGYKAAEKEFGVPRSTIRGWKAGRTEGKPKGARPSRARARARGRAREAEEDPAPGADDGPVDGEDYVAFLRRKLAELEQDRRQASARHHTQSAARLQLLIGQFREKLEQAEKARDAALRDAGELPDPARVARQVLELVPLLVRLEPELCRKLAADLEAGLG